MSHVLFYCAAQRQHGTVHALAYDHRSGLALVAGDGTPLKSPATGAQQQQQPGGRQGDAAGVSITVSAWDLLQGEIKLRFASGVPQVGGAQS